jgi:RimJ/RimL family protein N-acetyltransferase
MTIFETERLVIRPWTEAEADLARVFDIYSRWEVARWLGAQPRAMADRAEALTTVRRWDGFSQPDPRLGVWAIEVRDTGRVAGTVLVKFLPNSDGSPATDVEIGWHLHPDSWGHGYATEAGRGAADHAFANGVPEVFAVVYPDNAASLAVCRRLGMRPIGLTRRWYGIECEGFHLPAEPSATMDA